MGKTKQNSPPICGHCHLSCSDGDIYYNGDKTPFCCRACLIVNGYLLNNGLEKYYDILQERKTSSAKKHATQELDHLDDPEFKKKCQISSTPQRDQFKFYLEGLHCNACIWVLSQAPKLNPNLNEIDVNLAEGTITFWLKKNASLKEVALLFENLGYKAHPIFDSEDLLKKQKEEDRSYLLRIGIAAAGAGNIMIMAVGLYSGADGTFQELFEWLSFVLSIPVVFYSAWPFFKNSYHAIAQRRISIDIPLAFSILVGEALSVFNFATRSGELYFDSISVLIFLILISRYSLRKVQRKAIVTSTPLNIFKYGDVEYFNQEKKTWDSKAKSKIEKNDFLRVKKGEQIPADGKLKSKIGLISQAVLTGEGAPLTKNSGEEIFAGSLNEGETIEIEVIKTGEKTRFGNILSKVSESRTSKSELSIKTDKAAKFLLIYSFTLSLSIFLYWAFKDLPEAIDRSLAIVILTCPCALGLAIPLTISNAMKRAYEKGILVKDQNVIEKLSKMKSIFFDKTGTLTTGKIQVVKWTNHTQPLSHISNEQIVYSLEKDSQHPIATGICEYLRKQNCNEKSLKVTNWKESISKGVSGEVEGQKFEIKGLEFDSLKLIGLYHSSDLIATIELSDELRRESQNVIKELKQYVTPYLLTGDNSANALKISQEIGIPAENTLADHTPEMKDQIIENHKNLIMVGDGINDSLALSKADIGIAVNSSVDSSLKIANVYLTSPGLQPILSLFRIGQLTKKTISRNLIFSISYNLIGGILASMGHISPLIAAFLMPISSLIVITNSLLSGGASK